MNKIADEITKRASENAGVKILTKMVGVKSLKTGADYEEQAAFDELKAIQHDMGDECALNTEGDKPEDEGNMRDVLSAGPVTVNYGDTKQAKGSGVGRIASWGLAALGIGAGLSLPLVAWNMSRSETTEKTDIQNLGARFVPVPQPGIED